MNKYNNDDENKKALENKMNLAREIWLAGLGAYSKSVNEFAVAGQKSSNYFEALISSGKDVDARLNLYRSEYQHSGQQISLEGLEQLLDENRSRLIWLQGQKVVLLNRKIEGLLRQVADLKMYK